MKSSQASKDSDDKSKKSLIKIANNGYDSCYAKYSLRKKGASLRAVDNRIFRGSLVENDCLALTMCPERSALFTAVAQGAREFNAMYVMSRDGTSATCGACLQVLHEFSPQMIITHCNVEGDVLSEASVADMLRFPGFSGANGSLGDDEGKLGGGGGGATVFTAQSLRQDVIKSQMNRYFDTLSELDATHFLELANAMAEEESTTAEPSNRANFRNTRAAFLHGEVEKFYRNKLTGKSAQELAVALKKFFEVHPRTMKQRNTSTTPRAAKGASPAKAKTAGSAGKKRPRASKEEEVNRKKAKEIMLEVAEDTYEVSLISEHRKKKDGDFEFLVRWKGYGPEDDTWEPEEHIMNSLLSAYWQSVDKDRR